MGMKFPFGHQIRDEIPIWSPRYHSSCCFEAWSELIVKVSQWCPTPCDPMDYTVPGILQARILEWVAFPFSRWSSHPRDRTQVSRIAGAEPQGESKNIGVGSLSLLQWIFPTQKSNQSLLHCRQVLCQLSYQGNPRAYRASLNKITLGIYFQCLTRSKYSRKHTCLLNK